MTLYIKFKGTKATEEAALKRARSAVNFLNTLSNKATKFRATNISITAGGEVLSNKSSTEFSIGAYETFIRSAFKSKEYEPELYGIQVEGIIGAENLDVPFIAFLNPQRICHQSETADFYIDVLETKRTRNMQELANQIPELGLKIRESIITYNRDRSRAKELEIVRAIQNEGEFENIQDSSFFYSTESEYFVRKLIDSNQELKNRLSFGNKEKFIRRIINDDAFAALIDIRESQSHVGVMGGSITILAEKSTISDFVTQLALDFQKIAEKIFPTEEEAERKIQKELQTLIEQTHRA